MKLLSPDFSFVLFLTQSHRKASEVQVLLCDIFMELSEAAVDSFCNCVILESIISPVLLNRHARREVMVRKLDNVHFIPLI